MPAPSLGSLRSRAGKHSFASIGRRPQLLLLWALLSSARAAEVGKKADARLQTLTEKQLASKWFSRQPYFLVEWHGVAGQKLHEDLIPILRDVAQDLAGRAQVGAADTQSNSLIETFGLDTGKMPALYLFRRGEVIRKWEPLASWVQQGVEFTQGEIKTVTAEDIVEWAEEHMEKAEKREKKKSKARKSASKPPAEL